MSLILHVDTARWRTHLRRYLSDAASAGVETVPVAKGNGYGFGNAVLATEAASLGAGTLAVGTHDELPQVAAAFDGDVLVLSPWRPWSSADLDDDRVVHTVSRLDDLRALATGDQRPRVVLEIVTSMLRHGLAPDDLSAAAELLDGVRFEGFALHLPLSGNHAEEVRTLGARALAAAEAGGHRARTLWVSHLSQSDAAQVAEQLGAAVRLRVGTALWLGDRDAVQARARVLDVHRVARGTTFGYRQRRALRPAHLLVVGGGTAHGIALEAPTPAATLRQRAVSVAKGGLEAAGRSLSPFRVGGKQRWFAEPPHMQCSMLLVPDGVGAPAVGDEIDVDVRFTTTIFDGIAWLTPP